MSEETVIYYFSATGNSLAVARDLSKALGARTIPMVEALNGTHDLGDIRSAGLVFPLYDFKQPSLVDEILDHLDFRNRYVFAVATCGVSPGGGLKVLSRALAKRGASLSAGFSVLLPHNAVGSARMGGNDAVLFRRWDERLQQIAAAIRRREVLPPEAEPLLRAFLKPRILKTLPVVFKLLALLVFKGADSLRFSTNAGCNRCGTCRRVCPRDNISIREDGPNWGDDCLSCLACFQWCPQQAISFGGRNLSTRHYHHPNVTLKDMLRRN